MNNKGMTRRQTLAATGAIGLAAGLRGTPALAATEEFKIGAVLELSGADASGGQLAQRGYQFGIDALNKQGGITIGGKKYPVRMIVQDARSEPSAGADAATRLITVEKVDAMFGSYTSGVQIAMNAICAKYQVSCIAGSAESPGNWSSHPKFTFGMIPSVDLTADKALKFIVENAHPRPKTAAVIGANEPFSKDAAAGFAKGAKEAGLKLTTNTLFPPEADLSSVISALAADNPDIVAVGGHDTILINVIKAMKAQGFTPKAVIQHYGVTEPAFIQALGKDANGCCGIVDWDPSFPYHDALFGSAAEAAKRYKDEFKAEMDYTGAGCAASALVLQLAFQKLGKPPGLSEADRAKLNELIAATDIHTFYGPVKFDQSGPHFHDNTQPPPILIQIQNDQVTAVAPSTVAHAKLVYPLKSL